MLAHMSGASVQLHTATHAGGFAGVRRYDSAAHSGHTNITETLIDTLDCLAHGHLDTSTRSPCLAPCTSGLHSAVTPLLESLAARRLVSLYATQFNHEFYNLHF